jgi:hypothetical protein
VPVVGPTAASAAREALLCAAFVGLFLLAFPDAGRADPEPGLFAAAAAAAPAPTATVEAASGVLGFFFEGETLFLGKVPGDTGLPGLEGVW